MVKSIKSMNLSHSILDSMEFSKVGEVRRRIPINIKELIFEPCSGLVDYSILLQDICM